MSTKFIKAMRKLLSIIAMLFMGGCANTTCCLTTVQETDSAIRYVVIGFGVISIPKQKQNEMDGILATKMTAVGLVVTNQPGLKVGLGYSSSSVITVPNDTNNTVVEVSTCADEGMSVTAKSSKTTTQKE